MKAVPHLLLMPPNWIGDAIMAQPAMAAICAHHMRHCGTERISLCGRPWLNDLLPYLALPASTYKESIPKADAAFLFPGSFRAALQCRLAGIRRLTGYSGQWRKLLLNKALPHQISLKHEHHRNFYLDIARQCDIEIHRTDVCLSMPEIAIASAHARMKQSGLNPRKVVCIAPGAQFGAAKCYPASAFNIIVRQLAESGWQPVILGMPEDYDVGQIILHGVSAPCLNMAGTTSFAEALYLIAACRLMLCNDSGLMHVAAGLGIPTVTPFGATDPQRTSPSGPHVRVLYKPADCSPCLQRECTLKGHPCMTNIPPAELLEACFSMLQAVHTQP